MFLVKLVFNEIYSFIFKMIKTYEDPKEMFETIKEMFVCPSAYWKGSAQKNALWLLPHKEVSTFYKRDGP